MNDILKKYITKIKSPKLLVAIGLIGILLIFLSTFISGEKKETKKPVSTKMTDSQYQLKLENDISEMVKSITGSKKVNVVITLDSGIRYSYADINEGTSANKTESNSESTSNQSKQTYITVKSSDGGEEPLLVTTLMPEIRGVAIICEGGDNEFISEKICNAVTAALNITSKRVFIAGGNPDEKR